MLQIFSAILICFAFAPSNGESITASNCVEAVQIYGYYGNLPIKVPTYKEPFYVECEYPSDWLPKKKNDTMDPWNIILRREYGLENFNRSWSDYQQGFGDLKKDFFLGLKYIHALTSASKNELWVHLEDFKHNERWVIYDKFTIGSESEGYAITSLGAYSGNGGDSLSYHKGMKFTTYDKDNDNSELNNCAKLYSSGWWFNKCITSNLNGLWLKGEYKASFAHGIVWKDWLGLGYSLKYAHMAIRPKRKHV